MSYFHFQNKQDLNFVFYVLFSSIFTFIIFETIFHKNIQCCTFSAVTSRNGMWGLGKARKKPPNLTCFFVECLSFGGHFLEKFEENNAKWETP